MNIQNNDQGSREKKGILGVFQDPTRKLVLSKYYLYDGANTIGKDRSRCEIVIDVEDISEVHANIEINGEEDDVNYYITDLDSEQGIFQAISRQTTGKRTRIESNVKLNIVPDIPFYIGKYKCFLVAFDQDYKRGEESRLHELILLNQSPVTVQSDQLTETDIDEEIEDKEVFEDLLENEGSAILPFEAAVEADVEGEMGKYSSNNIEEQSTRVNVLKVEEENQIYLNLKIEGNCGETTEHEEYQQQEDLKIDQFQEEQFERLEQATTTTTENCEIEIALKMEQQSDLIPKIKVEQEQSEEGFQQITEVQNTAQLECRYDVQNDMIESMVINHLAKLEELDGQFQQIVKSEIEEVNRENEIISESIKLEEQVEEGNENIVMEIEEAQDIIGDSRSSEMIKVNYISDCNNVQSQNHIDCESEQVKEEEAEDNTIEVNAGEVSNGLATVQENEESQHEMKEGDNQQANIICDQNIHLLENIEEGKSSENKENDHCYNKTEISEVKEENNEQRQDLSVNKIELESEVKFVAIEEINTCDKENRFVEKSDSEKETSQVDIELLEVLNNLAAQVNEQNVDIEYQSLKTEEDILKVCSQEDNPNQIEEIENSNHCINQQEGLLDNNDIQAINNLQELCNNRQTDENQSIEFEGQQTQQIQHEIISEETTENIIRDTISNELSKSQSNIQLNQKEYVDKLAEINEQLSNNDERETLSLNSEVQDRITVVQLDSDEKQKDIGDQCDTEQHKENRSDIQQEISQEQEQLEQSEQQLQSQFQKQVQVGEINQFSQSNNEAELSDSRQESHLRNTEKECDLEGTLMDTLIDEESTSENNFDEAESSQKEVIQEGKSVTKQNTETLLAETLLEATLVDSSQDTEECQVEEECKNQTNSQLNQEGAIQNIGQPQQQTSSIDLHEQNNEKPTEKQQDVVVKKLEKEKQDNNKQKNIQALLKRIQVQEAEILLLRQELERKNEEEMVQKKISIQSPNLTAANHLISSSIHEPKVKEGKVEEEAKEQNFTPMVGKRGYHKLQNISQQNRISEEQVDFQGCRESLENEVHKRFKNNSGDHSYKVVVSPSDETDKKKKRIPDSIMTQELLKAVKEIALEDLQRQVGTSGLRIAVSGFKVSLENKRKLRAMKCELVEDYQEDCEFDLLVVNELKERTCRLLVAILKRKPVVSSDWLIDSIKQGFAKQGYINYLPGCQRNTFSRFKDSNGFCDDQDGDDDAVEERSNGDFDSKRIRGLKIFEGMTFYISNNIEGFSHSELGSLVKAGSGSIRKTVPSAFSMGKADTAIVVLGKSDLNVFRTVSKLGNVVCVNCEFILRAALYLEIPTQDDICLIQSLEYFSN